MSRLSLLLVALVGGVVGAGASLLVERAQGGAVGPQVRGYLLGHPEVVEEAIGGMQQMQTARLVRTHRDAIDTPYPGAEAGNSKGDVTIAEYFDYNCGYCRASLPALAQLLHADPGVRLVYRELPILAESSRDAARASLAAAAQGRYEPFHQALYAAGPVTSASIAAAGRMARIDPARVPADADTELARNREAYTALGMAGTPSWVIGDKVLSGVQSLDALQTAVAAARAAKAGGSDAPA